MSLQTLVKISNITNLSDARYCAGMGVEMLGFSMDSLSVQKFNEIKGWVAGVQIVGETESDNLQVVTELVQQYAPDYLQISQLSLLDGIGVLGLPVLLNLDFATQTEAELQTIMERTKGQVAYYLLENSDEFARIETDTLDVLNRLTFHFPVLVGFGITELNCKEILKELTPTGIALTGGDEIRPGYKDFGEMMGILEALEEE